MNLVIRSLMIVTLLLPFTCALTAQETSSTATTETASATAATTAPETTTATNSFEVRGQFSELLRHSPPELSQMFALEPALLADPNFLARYPEIARFVQAHPEMARHASFYVEDFQTPEHREGPVGEIMGPVMAFAGFSMFVFAIGWLVRAWIEQKRWSRLSRTQTEVHNKILDRFGSSPELLEYIKSPAGTKFLESAPISVRAEPSSLSAPMARVMWSVQLGVIIAAASVGMLLVSGRFDKDSGQGLFALGMIALSIGVGFIGSAAVSLFLSRRLGLWQPPQSADDAGLVQ
jgi:hypothetical protein